jgi:hypothetical protein
MNFSAPGISIAVLFAAIFVHPAAAQTPTMLIVDVQDVVEYQADISDASKFGLSPGITPPIPFKNFAAATIIGDIVAVNGQPAKGLYTGRSRAVVVSRAPTPGAAIGDVNRTAMREIILEIAKLDGASVGVIMSSGFSGGQTPPGLSADQRGNWAISGGTGAFFGARGQLTQRLQGLERIAPRAASMAEDPANRRINGGGMIRLYVRVIPISVPEIVTTNGQPVVVHSSDFSLVTASKPAVPGEILSMFARGLGPTLPEPEPGELFPLSPLAPVNSPLVITMNGKPAEVLAAVGYPGTADAYQVNFRMPPDAGKGSVRIQMTSAWIAAPPVSITAQ